MFNSRNHSICSREKKTLLARCFYQGTNLVPSNLCQTANFSSAVQPTPARLNFQLDKVLCAYFFRKHTNCTLDLSITQKKLFYTFNTYTV